MDLKRAAEGGFVSEPILSHVSSLTESPLNQIAEQARMVTQARNCFGCIAMKELFNVPGVVLLSV